MVFPKLPRNKKQGNIYLLSDNHHFHKNICYGTSIWKNKNGCRPFENYEKMNKLIIKNINDIVNVKDYLICLGDFSFGGKDNLIEARKQIKCENFLTLIGNHTQCLRSDKNLQKLFLWVGDYLEFRYDGWLINCCHYPIDSWNEMHKRSIMCHGHCHQTLKRKLPRRFDLSLEGLNYKPIDIQRLIELSKNQYPDEVDHHTKQTNIW